MSRTVPDELMSAYLDGELTADEQAVVQRALAVDPDLRRTYEQLLALRGALQLLPEHRLGDDFSAQVLRRVAAAASPFPSRASVAGRPSAPPRPAAEGIEQAPQISVAPLAASYRRHRRRYIAWTAAVAAIAATAAVLMLTLHQPLIPRHGAISARHEAAARRTGPLSPPARRSPTTTAGPARQAARQGGSGTMPPEQAPPERGPVDSPAHAPRIEHPSPADLPRSQPEASAVARAATGVKQGVLEAPPTLAGPATEPPPAPCRTESVSPAPPAALEFAARLEPWIETGVGATLSSPFARPRPLPGELIVLLDNNQDGLVSDQEVHQAAAVFQRLANSRDRSRSGQAILESLDLNRDGVLDQPEALQGAGYARLSVEGLGKAFSLLLGVLDANADGLVTVSELTRLVDRLGRMRQAVEPRLPQLFASLDANGDGMISVVESQMGADAFVRQSGIEIQLLGVPGQQQLTPAVMPTVRAKIQRLDRNRDGRLSRREAKPDDLLRQAFGDVDRDGDNTLAPGEIYDYLKTRLPPQPQWRGIRLRVNVPRAVPMRNR